MELCDVCGSFLVIGDTQSRVDAHLLGKQHIGFARIRTAIEELKVCNSVLSPSLASSDVTSNVWGIEGSSLLGKIPATVTNIN